MFGTGARPRRKALVPAWGSDAAASIVAGFIVWGLVTFQVGPPTGPCLNPARDLMPRLLHANRRSAQHSRWGEASIPVVVSPDCRRHYRRLAVRVLSPVDSLIDGGKWPPLVLGGGHCR